MMNQMLDAQFDLSTGEKQKRETQRLFTLAAQNKKTKIYKKN